MRKLVCFFLHGRELAAPIDAVRETVGLTPITPVFLMPPCVAGITSLRGEILAVLDTAVLMGMAPCKRDPGTRIVIVEHADRAAGLLVDGLGSIPEVADDAVGPIPPTVPPNIAGMLEGVLTLPDRPIAVLDIERLLDAPDLAPYARSPRAQPETPQETAGT